MKKLLPLAIVVVIILFAARKVYIRFIAIPELPIETSVLTDRGGVQYDLKHDDHPYILVSYIQSWCGDCMVEVPSMLQLVKEQGKEKIRLVLISDEPREKILRIEQRFENQITVYQSDRPMKSMDIHIFPTTFLLGPDRKILLVKKEGFDWNGEQVRAMVN
jgi:thiol-disulfide isomerase/thioredoxin